MHWRVMHRTGLTLLLACGLPYGAHAQTEAARREKAYRELDPAFYGKWRLDVSRSSYFQTVTYKQVGDRIEASGTGEPDIFKIDGKDYPTSTPGETTMWKQTGPHTFESTQKVNGKVVGTRVREISPDGETMTATYHNGNSAMVIPFRKVSGGSNSNPLIGTWKAGRAQATASKPEVLALERAPDGLHYVRSTGAEYTISFDGRESPVTGSGAPERSTARLKWINSREFQIDRYTNSKLSFTQRFSLSPDGKTMKDGYTRPGAVGEPMVLTWVKE